jgi:hypothetical protein
MINSVLRKAQKQIPRYLFDVNQTICLLFRFFMSQSYFVGAVFCNRFKYGFGGR